MFACGILRKVSPEYYAIVDNGRIEEIVRINYKKQKTLPVCEGDYVYIEKVSGECNYVEILGYNNGFGYKVWRKDNAH